MLLFRFNELLARPVVVGLSAPKHSRNSRSGYSQRCHKISSAFQWVSGYEDSNSDKEYKREVRSALLHGSEKQFWDWPRRIHRFWWTMWEVGDIQTTSGFKQSSLTFKIRKLLYIFKIGSYNSFYGIPKLQKTSDTIDSRWSSYQLWKNDTKQKS